MSKLTREARAFAQRVKMGKSRFCLLVEGRIHDQAFYDRLLESHPEIVEMGFKVRLAEQVELGEKSSGGKTHLSALHQFYEKEGLLRQSGKRGDSLLVFAMDKDFDDAAGNCIESEHVLYTSSMDVESEILLNGDVARAASSAYSLPMARVRKALPQSHVSESLANLWREWITYGVAAYCCGIGGAAYSNTSKFNSPTFGPLDEDLASKAFEELASRAKEKGCLSQVQMSTNYVANSYVNGRGGFLVKGKWVAKYVWHLIDESTKGIPRDKNVTANVLTKTCLETLDFSGAWAKEYRVRLDALLAA